MLASKKKIMYSNQCCDMIAVKREVATLSSEVGFPWSECQETIRSKNLTTSHCTNKLSAKHSKQKRRVKIDGLYIATHTGECTVTACRTYLIKVRKGGDFFYGKSGNENYIESV